MNHIKVTIKEIQNFEEVFITTFDFENITLKMISLKLENIQENQEVTLGVNPSNIIIAKDYIGEISFSNKFKAKIVKIENGKLLSTLYLKINSTILETILTVDSIRKMDLKTNDSIIVFIKASHLSIVEINND